MVSIIILMFNHAKLTLKCISEVLKNTKGAPYEVILFDNGSENFESRLLRKELTKFKNSKVRYIKSTKNLGFARANNLCAKEAGGEILVFLNNDVIVTKGWLKPILAFLAKNEKVAACQPKLHSFTQRDCFDYAGGSGGFLDMFGYPFTRGRVIDSVEKDVGQYEDICEIAWATGACLIVRKKQYQEVGGFDEYFFSYAEEVDLCLHLSKRGYKVYCIPESLVYHYGAYTSNHNLRQKIYLIHRNHLYLVLKYYSIWPYLPLIIFRVFLDIASIFYYLYELKIGFILSVLRAYLEIFKDIRKFIRGGIITWSGKSLLTNNNVYRGSIALERFLGGKKSYDGKKREYKRYKDITYFGGSG